MSTRTESLHSRTTQGSAWGKVQLAGVTSCLVGYHMIWMFPHNMHVYSAAYLLPYYLCLMLVITPLVYIQLHLGGATQSNITAMLSYYCPILKGVGIACLIRLFIYSMYQSLLLAYAIFFTFASLQQPYMWGMCDADWNTIKCWNSSMRAPKGHFPAEQEFFENQAVQMSDGISREVSIPWHLAAGMIASWTITFIIICGGVSRFGTLMVIFGSVGAAISIALLAYSREEVEHGDPEIHLYKTRWELLTDEKSNIWTSATVDLVKMVYMWFGVLPTMGKHAGPGIIITNVSWIFVVALLAIAPHIFTMIICTFMGALHAATGSFTQKFIHNEWHMLFVAMPAAFHHLELKRGVAFVFYFFIFLFGLQNQALLSIVFVENLIDGVGHKFLDKIKSESVMFALYCAAFCGFGLIMSLTMTTEGGMYMVLMIHHWLDKLICFLIFFGVVAFLAAYAKQAYSLVNKIIVLSWSILAGLLLIAMTAFAAAFHLEPKRFELEVKQGINYVYPVWAYVIGWLIAGGPILIGLVFGAVHAVAQVKGTGLETLLNAVMGPGGPQTGKGFQPMSPASPDHRDGQHRAPPGIEVQPRLQSPHGGAELDYCGDFQNQEGTAIISEHY